jgi:endonuclease/exonuclease/phosphatase family metal-dependent hydrolase
MKNLKYLLFTCCIALLYSCAEKVTSSNSKGSKTSVNALRVLTYNIHHGNPPSMPGKIDIDAIAKAIKAQQPDLVALQEVDFNTIRSGKMNQAVLLAQKLQMNFFFAKAIDYDGGEYGVAILSRYPLSDTNIQKLTTQTGTKGEPRVLATVLITLPDGKKIRFGSTHLDAQKEDTNRLLQVGELNAYAQQEKLPFILGGDLNAMPGSTPIMIFDQQYNRTCEPCEFTIPVIKPTKAIDFIAVSKKSRMEVISHKVIPETYASDHLPVLTVIKLL